MSKPSKSLLSCRAAKSKRVKLSTLVAAIWLTGGGLHAVARADDANQEPEFAIRPGEIRLDGIIQSISPAQGIMLVHLTSFTQPDGKRQKFFVLMPKRVKVTAETHLYRRGDKRQRLAVGDLKAGAVVVAIGTDMGMVNDLFGREVAVDYSGLELTAQLTDLKARMDRLKEAVDMTPTVYGLPPDYERDTLSRQQINALIGALRAEWADGLNLLATRIDHVETRITQFETHGHGSEKK